MKSDKPNIFSHVTLTVTANVKSHHRKKWRRINVKPLNKTTAIETIVNIIFRYTQSMLQQKLPSHDRPKGTQHRTFFKFVIMFWQVNLLAFTSILSRAFSYDWQQMYRWLTTVTFAWRDGLTDWHTAYLVSNKEYRINLEMMGWWLISFVVFWDAVSAFKCNWIIGSEMICEWKHVLLQFCLRFINGIGF